jgi:hypothetical protein
MRKEAQYNSGMFNKFYPNQNYICTNSKLASSSKAGQSYELREGGRGAKAYPNTTVAQIGPELCTTVCGRGRCYRLRSCWQQVIGGPIKICVKHQHFNEYEVDAYKSMAQRHILSIVRFLYYSEMLGGCLWTQGSY